MAIKAVLFDLDGTLLDREKSIRQFAADQYDRHADMFFPNAKQYYIDRFIALDNRGKVWKDEVYQKLLIELNITAIAWQILLDDYIGQFRHHCIPFDNLINMLDQLKARNMALGLISNGRTLFQRSVIEALGLSDYFSIILISEEQGMRKPQPEIFLKALRELNATPQEAVFVGDDPEADIRGAQGAGMNAIWKRTDGISCNFADGEIDDLAALPNLIAKPA